MNSSLIPIPNPFFMYTHNRYKGPDRHKLSGPILDGIYANLMMIQRKFLEQRTGYGRCVTGDGATVQGTKYINFLCHEYSKGSMLCGIQDCTGRLSKVGSVEATFIAHNLMGAVRFEMRYLLTHTHIYKHVCIYFTK